MSKFDLNSFIGTPDVMKNAVQNIDINKLVPYKNHCFKLYEGERLDDMVRSVQLYGIMVPIIVRSIVIKTGVTEMDDMMLMQFVIDLFGADTIEMMKEEGLPTENIVNLSVREQYHIIQTYLDKTAEQARKYFQPIAQKADDIYNSYEEKQYYRHIDMGYMDDEDYNE